MTPHELTKLFVSLLDDQEIEPEDNFFDMGGTSILALRLVTEIEERWGAQLGLIDVIQHPTPTALAERADQVLAGTTDLDGDIMETAWDIVSSQALRTPRANAIRSDVSQTYEELADQVRDLAAEIGARTVPGQVVAVTVDRPSSAAAALLAAASCRCPALPLNSDSPPLHRDFVLADAKPALAIRELPGGRLSIDDVSAGQASARADLERAAYIMYTSGSTGRPKGVVVPHDALLSRLRALARVPGLDERDSMLALTAPSFDISMAELLLPLAVGGTVVSAPASARVDPAVFAETVTRHQPSVIQATPSFWRLAIAWGWQGADQARLWCGGEALTPSLAQRLSRLGSQAWNLYGPTEATIWATAARIRPDDPVHLGEPLPGARLFLEGERGEFVRTPGDAGEIVIYGSGLAVGYLNRPELTAERFSVRDTPDGARRCYLTGDRAAYTSDGRLQFLGRGDGQIKLRGHRIELGELEAVAEEQPGVREVAAILRDGTATSTGSEHEAHIQLFVVADSSVSARDVRRWLAARLPPAMRPARVDVVPRLPRTIAGKIDRVALAQAEKDS